MWNNKLVSFLVTTILLLSLALICFSISNNNLQKRYKEFVYSSKVTEQNHLAAIDSLKQIPDSLQDYKVFVKELRNSSIKNKTIKGKLDSKIILLENIIATLKSDTTIKTIVVYKDLDSNFITVPFNISFKKVNVVGKTDYEVKTKLKSFTLKIEKEPYSVESYLYFDPKDSTVSNTVSIDGEKIKATTAIDSDLHKLVLNGLPREEKFLDRLKGGTYISYNDKIDIGAILKYNYFNYTLSASKSYYNWDVKLEYIKSFNGWFK